jgi:hypothetical protein
MKKNYYVNRNQQINGDHEVHAEGCRYMPNPANRIHLGEFSSCRDAVEEAKKYYPKASGRVNGCLTCSTVCHSS